MQIEYSSLLKACGCDPYGVYNDNGVLIESFKTKDEAEKFINNTK